MRNAAKAVLPVPDALNFAVRLQWEYEARTTVGVRKSKGQYFTSPEVSRFMALLISRREFPKTFRLLDPGAGIGALSAAVCQRVSLLRSPRHLEIHLFENDIEVLPFLTRTMEHCCECLRNAGHSLTYRIHEQDFILDAAASLFSPPSLFSEPADLGDFDGAIMNPPYFKVNKESPYARVMEDVVHGQPNMYAFFLAAVAQMLRPGGDLIAITPRSFCNGPYFRGFRKWFFERMGLDHIHLFESRTAAFHDVLQESLITASHRLGKPSTSVTVTTSHGPDMRIEKPSTLPTSTILDNSSGNSTIRIPSTAEDLQITEIVESWPDRFHDLGLRVSTGPVVMFRATDFLARLPDKHTVPLLAAFNVMPFKTEWPVPHKKHPIAFKVSSESQRLLLPVRNYVLLRRFSAKEERRRLTASCLLASSFDQHFIALENHLNYVYHPERELTVEEVFGLAAFFNSSLLDRYFRTLSGNTQVNATELRSMRFPSLATLTRIGGRARSLPALDHDMVESIVLEELGVGVSLKAHLLLRTLFDPVLTLAQD